MSSPFATLDYGPVLQSADAARAFLAAAAAPPAVAAGGKAARGAAAGWRKAAPAMRARKLRALSKLLSERTGFLAALAALTDQRPVRATLAHDVPRAVAALAQAAGPAPVAGAASGLAAVILPQTSGMAAIAGAAAPLLAAGQGLIIASSAPRARAFAALAAEAGLPRGLVQLAESDPATEDMLIARSSVSHVSFTGPHGAALALRARLAGSGKSASFTLIGPMALIVHEEADLDGAVEAAADLLWPGQGGEVRLFAQEGIAPRFSGKLVNRLSRLRFGDPLDANSDMATGTTPVNPKITTFRTPDEAVQLANHARDLLAASVWSENISFAMATATGLAAETIWLNSSGLALPVAVPTHTFPRPGQAAAGPDALAAAVQAQAPWAALAPAARAEILLTCSEKLPAKSAARVQSLIAEAQAAAGSARLMKPGLMALTVPEALGVIALEPVQTTLDGLAAALVPALAAGNAVILNAPDTPARRALKAAFASLPPGLIAIGSPEKILSDERFAGSFAGAAPLRYKTIWLPFGT